jgi:hypothetical protein
MSIRVTVNNANPLASKQYPYLGVNEGTIVLFTGKDTGTVLYDNTKSGDGLGKNIDFWDERVFAPFQGEITLRNE